LSDVLVESSVEILCDCPTEISLTEKFVRLSLFLRNLLFMVAQWLGWPCLGSKHGEKDIDRGSVFVPSRKYHSRFDV
jgi:hypothetical protein